MDIFESQARVFSRYLVGQEASLQAVKVYSAAMADSRPSAADQKLLRFMVAHPWSIGLIDAGLVFHRSESEARRRLYVMLAILEASPEGAKLFLPIRRGPLYIFAIAASCVRAAVKAVLGLVLVKVID